MTTNYSIPEMEDALKSATSVILGEIKEKFRIYLSELLGAERTLDNLSRNSQIAACRVRDHDSLKSIYSMQGFYIICTEHSVPGNNCIFSLNENLTAIYRGECSSVRRRVESHLFNKTYQELYENRKKNKISKGDKFSEPYYGACMKVDPSVSGINIDSLPYSKSSWAVVVLKMPGSSSLVRKQAELAFDGLFNKPIASRE